MSAPFVHSPGLALVAGERSTGWRGELFDLLSEQGPLQLTAMTRIEWGAERSLVDAVLFSVAEGASVSEAAQSAGVSVQQASAWVQKSDEPELTGRNNNSD
jgi:hypothetical protein